MGLKPTVITNLSYKRVGQHKGLRNLAKYLQFRDGSIRRDAYLRGDGYGGPEVSDDARPSNRPAQWVDRGMGESYSQIANRAHELQGRFVLARTWVISPDPELMANIPENQRLQAMQQITERTVELWYADNGWGTPEYSYVLHAKINSKGMSQSHAHVITPGTIPLEPNLGRIDHFVKTPHIRDLRQVAEGVFDQELERALGRDRAMQIMLDRGQRLTRGRGHDHHQLRERLGFGRDMVSVMRLLAAGRHDKQRQPGIRDLNLFQRHVRREEIRTRRKKQGLQLARWEAEHRLTLEQARQQEQARQGRMRVRRQREQTRDEREHALSTFAKRRDFELDLDL